MTGMRQTSKHQIAAQSKRVPHNVCVHQTCLFAHETRLNAQELHSGAESATGERPQDLKSKGCMPMKGPERGCMAACPGGRAPQPASKILAPRASCVAAFTASAASSSGYALPAHRAPPLRPPTHAWKRIGPQQARLAHAGNDNGRACARGARRCTA